MVSLSAPQYELYEKVRATLGGDPYVRIPEMIEDGKHYIINIITVKGKQAYALKELLKTRYEFGNIIVDIVISSQEQSDVHEVEQNPKGLKKLVDWALGSNFYYVLSLIIDRSNPYIPPMYGDVALVFRKKIVRYYVDDMYDAYGVTNEIAAEAFREILKESFFGDLSLSFSTNPDKN